MYDTHAVERILSEFQSLSRNCELLFRAKWSRVFRCIAKRSQVLGQNVASVNAVLPEGRKFNAKKHYTVSCAAKRS